MQRIQTNGLKKYSTPPPLRLQNLNFKCSCYTESLHNQYKILNIQITKRNSNSKNCSTNFSNELSKINTIQITSINPK